VAVNWKAASATKEMAGSVLQQSLRRAMVWRRMKVGHSGQRSALGVEVDNERWSGVGEHSAAVAVKRRRKVRLATALRRQGPARGAALGAAAACVARGGRKAGGARRSGSWRGRHAALAVGASTHYRDDARHARHGKRPGGPGSPSQCGFGLVTKQGLGRIEQWAASSSAQYFSNYLKTAPIF
jgi:hypothetical protein